MKSVLTGMLLLVNLAAIVSSNVGLKLSATAPDWRGFLTWQVFGNLTGFLGVLSFTALLRFVPLNVGFGITAGLGFVLVQVVGARLFFQEPISSLQWLGAGLVVGGVGLIAFGQGQ